MKITDIKCFPVWATHRNQLVLKIETDEEYYGWGEAGVSGRELAVEGAVKHYRERDHAWFAAFAPFDAPRIAVVVILEHGGSGGKQAAPVVREIIDQYQRKIDPIFPKTAALPNRSKRRVKR